MRKYYYYKNKNSNSLKLRAGAIVYYHPNIVSQENEKQQRTGEISLGGNKQKEI